MSALTNVEKVIHVPARTGASVTVPKGSLIRFTDLEGHQPIDLWAFSQGDPWEFLSPEHTKPSIEKLFPRMGDSAYSNFRNPIVTLIEDNSPGQHDMEYAACDQARYVELGAPMPHASCQDNLHKELKKLGLDVKGVPTFSGYLAANCWAIIEPIEVPWMCPLAIPRASISPAVSSAQTSIS